MGPHLAVFIIDPKIVDSVLKSSNALEKGFIYEIFGAKLMGLKGLPTSSGE